MLELLLTAVAVGWALWSLAALLMACVLMYCLPQMVLEEVGALTTGVLRPRIHVARRLERQLTIDEYCAVVAHERGHVAHGHVRLNFARIVLLPFWPRSTRTHQRQELEADAWVVSEHGARYGRALASALRKTSSHPFDLERAARLDWSSRMLDTFAGRDVRS